MDYRTLHSWDVSPSEAIAIQKNLRACLILVEAPFSIIKTAIWSLEVDFSYISGLLALREIPVVLGPWEKLKHRPDCIAATRARTGASAPDRVCHTSRFDSGSPCHRLWKNLLEGKIAPLLLSRRK